MNVTASSLVRAASRSHWCRQCVRHFTLYLPVDGVRHARVRGPARTDLPFAKPNVDGITVARFPAHLSSERIEITTDAAHSKYRARSYHSLSFIMRTSTIRRIMDTDPNTATFITSDSGSSSSNGIGTGSGSDNDSGGGGRAYKVKYPEYSTLLPCPLLLPPTESLILVSIVTGKRALVRNVPATNRLRRRFAAALNTVLNAYCVGGVVVWVEPNFAGLLATNVDTIERELIFAMVKLKLVRRPVHRDAYEHFTNSEGAKQKSGVWWKHMLESHGIKEGKKFSALLADSGSGSGNDSGDGGHLPLSASLAVAVRLVMPHYCDFEDLVLQFQSLTHRYQRHDHGHGHKDDISAQSLNGFASGVKPRSMRILSRDRLRARSLPRIVQRLLILLGDRMLIDERDNDYYIERVLLETELYLRWIVDIEQRVLLLSLKKAQLHRPKV